MSEPRILNQVLRQLFLVQPGAPENIEVNRTLIQEGQNLLQAWQSGSGPSIISYTDRLRNYYGQLLQIILSGGTSRLSASILNQFLNELNEPKAPMHILQFNDGFLFALIIYFDYIGSQLDFSEHNFRKELGSSIHSLQKLLLKNRDYLGFARVLPDFPQLALHQQNVFAEVGRYNILLEQMYRNKQERRILLNVEILMLDHVREMICYFLKRTGAPGQCPDNLLQQ